MMGVLGAGGLRFGCLMVVTNYVGLRLNIGFEVWLGFEVVVV
jgi:hypothetical protein